MKLIIAFLLTLLAFPAAAQVEFATPQAGKTAQGVLTMCLNGSNQAVPCGSGGSTGVVAGNTSNSSSNIAPTSTNVPTNSYQYCWDGSNWDQCPGLLTGTPGAPSTDVLTVQGPIAGGSYPTAATPIQGNSTGTTGAVVGTLAGVASKTTYLCDFDISALGTANTPGPIVIAGLLGGSKTYQMSTLATGVAQNLSKTFNPCLPASAANTAITITTTAAAGGTAIDVNSSGYQQ